MEIVVEGRTTEEAIETACRNLDLPRALVEIEVLTSGSMGIFGIVGVKKAKVRARPKKSAVSPEAVGGQGTSSQQEPSSQEVSSEVTEQPEPPPAGGTERRSSRSRRRRRGGKRGPTASAVAAEMPEDAAGLGEPPEEAEEAIDDDDDDSVEPESAEGEPEPELPLPDESVVATAHEVCQRIIDDLGAEVQVNPTALPGEVRLELLGADSSMLIGHRGEVLNALQHIVSKITNRRTAARAAVVLDAEGWRQQRRQSLEELARKLAQKAKQSGKPVSLSPMNAHDRRIIHLALEHDPEIRTKSAGDGALRKVVISPHRSRRGAKSARPSAASKE
ncbi:MAG: RNA-binding cell elongation regulator Jag/EloR [Pseudomonadota bacterium]